MSQFKFYSIIAISLAFLSFFMSALVSDVVFDRLPHLEDEFAYIFQARIFARGHVVVEIREPDTAFWQPFVISYEETWNRFGKYTPGWPLILSLGVIAGQMWIVNAGFAALNVALIYRLAGEIFNRRVGMIAAALAAFSPMALLLNATLMNHSSALFFATAFLYAYWRIEQGTNARRWGLIAGIALGLLAISRPVSAAAIAFPFIVWSLSRLGWSTLASETQSRILNLRGIVLPLIVLAGSALLISALIPLFNQAAVGDPTHNLYLEVWEYDRIGFGDCCGNPNSRHNIVKGVNHARWDLSLMAADLFGWQLDLRDGVKPGQIDEALQEHLRTENGYWPLIGLSFFILPIGLLRGFKSRWMQAWLFLALAWLVISILNNGVYRINDDTRRMLWLRLGLGVGWLLIPFFTLSPFQIKNRQTRWTFLLLWTFISLVLIHLAYWVGSQRYSTRYYFEALAGLVIIGALAFDWLIQTTSTLFHRLTGVSRSIGLTAAYSLFALALLWSLYSYSTPRINALHAFNQVSQKQIAAVEALSEDDRPILVIVSGHSGMVRWRAYGSLLAITDPYFENDIITARDYAPDDPGIRAQILAQFPDHQVIDMAAVEVSAWFVDNICETGEELSASPDCQRQDTPTGG